MLHNTDLKKREIFAQIEITNTAIVRIDGRGFGKALRQLQFSKPYDIRFAKGMADSTETFFQKSGINPSLAYIFSDEINLLFTKNLPFNGRLEKIDSVIPSYFSSALVLALESLEPLSFDSRVVIIDTADIIEYLKWRQEECWRNLMSSYGYYLLKSDGMTAKEAAEKLKGLKSDQLHELAWDHGINLAQTPAWQRRGMLVNKEKTDKTIVNPLTGKETIVQKSRIIQNWEPPLFKNKAGSQLVDSIIKNYEV
ncbi:MAG TPA: tRNA(His) guanylyltransferase Thg1 family protein [Candidatus Nanoarchaeia archaeon]|nr:tRNA(His) guanylyltransferase Thg1 family protein [Candidatus Nanoarchaeia archaeon]